MAKPSSELTQRVIGGSAIAAFAAIVIWQGGPLFSLVMALAVVILLREFVRLTLADAEVKSLIFAGFWPVLAIVAFQFVSYRQEGETWAIVVALVVVLAGAGLSIAIALSGRISSWIAVGIAYVGIPVIALLWLRQTNGDEGLYYVCWLVVVVVATDVCAYAVGRRLGGAKLAPRISPGKTWSGLFGGMAGAALLGTIAGRFWMAPWPVWQLAVLALVLAFLAQAGDLFESWLKRRAGLKDSGNLIPGHGGLMDRLDGYMTASPAFALFVLMTAGR